MLIPETPEDLRASSPRVPGGSHPAPHGAAHSVSRVYSWSFNAALLLWVIGTERFIAAATGSGVLAVVAAWWARGGDRIVLSFVWVGAALAFAGLAAAMARHVFIAATGRPEPNIFLGAAENGFYAAHERTRPWTPSSFSSAGARAARCETIACCRCRRRSRQAAPC